MKVFLILYLFFSANILIAQSFIDIPDFDEWKGHKFSLVDYATTDGDTLSESFYQNKVCFLIFYRLGCPPCMKEISTLNKLKKHYEEENGLVVVGLCEANLEEYKRFIKYHTHKSEASSSSNLMLNYHTIPIPEYPIVLVGRKNFFNKYKVTGVPVSLIIDRNGVVVEVFKGFSPSTKEDKEVWLQNNIETIDELLKNN